MPIINNKYTKNTQNVILVVNKVDNTNYEKLFPELQKFNSLEGVKDIVPVSALKGKNIEELIKVIKSYLTDNVKYYDDETYTDKSLKFMVSEIIREKTLWLLQDELPHGIAIDIVRFNEGDKVCEIDADIILEKSSHKQIVIGKKGAMLKEIGTRSRIDIERLLEQKVMLKLFVKIREDWRRKDSVLNSVGYNQQDL